MHGKIVSNSHENSNIMYYESMSLLSTFYQGTWEYARRTGELG